MYGRIFVYARELPRGVNEVVVPNPTDDGYTVLIDPRQCPEKRKRSLTHAVAHIVNGDFERQDVPQIERRAHRMA